MVEKRNKGKADKLPNQVRKQIGVQNQSQIQVSSSRPSSSSRNWTHDVFPSFRGEDVRRDFLSHIQKEFKRKGITPFNDNGIKRGESIGPELIRGIRESKIAIILLSKNYASSKWCLEELEEIMKCKEELGQTVMAIFYKVDPSDVKKLTEDFGKVFRETCEGKSKEDIGRWKQALEKVATIAGYHSTTWDNEAAMIEEIAIDVSNELINYAPSSDFDGLVGMTAHMEKMEQFLLLGSNEVRMIGIWGPSGIGKSTIARVLFSQHSHKFQLSVFMDDIKRRYPRLGFNEYSTKLKLQKEFLSQIIDQEDIKIHHLGVVQDRSKDKRVLVVLDDVDHRLQLDAMAKEPRWFGRGSRIIITTQDKKLLYAHGINHIYHVEFPPDHEALEIFCIYAFGQKSPYDGFKKLSWEVTKLAGNLPLGLRVMGSYFKGMPKEEWEEELPRLKSRLDGEIESILKFSYDALFDEDQALFLFIACFFNGEQIEKLEEYLADTFVGLKGRLRVLAEKSFISDYWQWGYIKMHDLLVSLGREIVRKQSIHEPGQRQFLVDPEDIGQVLRNDTLGSPSVIGINFKYKRLGRELKISDRAFERMSNVRFLRLHSDHDGPIPFVLENVNYLPPNLRFLHWDFCPMVCLPSNFNPEFLVEIILRQSNDLQKLWEGNKTIRNLKWMDLSGSKNLKELPDLSTASSLQILNLENCLLLVKLPFSIGNLRKLYLGGCSSLVELPSSTKNSVNLEDFSLSGCSSLVDLEGCSSLPELPSFIGNMTSVRKLNLKECSSLLKLPSSIGNLTNLEEFDLTGCSSLVELPSSIGNLHNLGMLNMQGCSKLQSLTININMESLDSVDLSDCSSLKSFGQISTNIRFLILSGTPIEDIGFIKEMSRLKELIIKGCTKLVSLPQLPSSLAIIDADNCKSLESLDFSSYKTEFADLSFLNCFKLNQEARDLILKTTTKRLAVLPGEAVPTYFTYRATENSLSMKSNVLDTHFPTSLKFKACVLLVNFEAGDWEIGDIIYFIKDKLSGVQVNSGVYPLWFRSSLSFSEKHLFVFEFETTVTSGELIFEFDLMYPNKKWEIEECGLHPLETFAPPC